MVFRPRPDEYQAAPAKFYNVTAGRAVDYRDCVTRVKFSTTDFANRHQQNMHAQFSLTADDNSARRHIGSRAEFFVTRLSSSIRPFNMTATHHSVGLRGEHG
jgi:hypothetical protein